MQTQTKTNKVKTEDLSELLLNTKKDVADVDVAAYINIAWHTHRIYLPTYQSQMNQNWQGNFA